MIDLSSISIEQLRNMQKELPSLIAQRKAEKLTELQAAVCQLIEESGLTRAEVLGPLLSAKPARKGGGSATVAGMIISIPAGRYRNPQNAAQEWLGRGKRPRWLAALLEEGYTLDQLRMAA